MKARRPLALIACALAIFLATEVSTPAQSNWRRIDTPNFVVIGEISVGILRDVALQFEAFRGTLARLHGPRVVGSPVPTVIILFPTETTMAPFRPKYNGKPVDVAGLVVPGRDVNYTALIYDGNPEARANRLRVIFHEYTHIVTQNSSQRLPVWLSEGIAEYYSTFEPIKDGREAIIGNIIGEHLLQLNGTVLMPIAEMLKIDHNSPLYNEGSRRSVFYAQSWALVHMILRAEPSRAPQLAAYVDRLSKGAEPVAAWQEAFAGLNMDQELDRYIRRQSFSAVKYGFGEGLAKLNTTGTQMTPSDVQGFLADFQAELDDYDAAAARLTDLAKRDPTSPRGTVAAARLNLLQGRYEDVGEKLRTLPPPTDWFLAYLAGVSLAEQVARTDTTSAANIEAVERLLAVARASGHEFPNAVYRAATLELLSDAAPSAETEAALERARQLSPGRDDYTFLHAQLLVRRKDFGKARSLLGTLLATGTPDVRSEARAMLGRVAEYENALASGGAQTMISILPSRAGAPSVPPSPFSSTSVPPSSPLYRVVKPGEQRLEAIFEKSECVVGKGITFFFKAGDQTVTATAQKFDDVEFITYRTDLTGSISCGPAKEPMKVFLTWKPGASEGSKVAVAIEFLPKTDK